MEYHKGHSILGTTNTMITTPHREQAAPGGRSGTRSHLHRSPLAGPTSRNMNPHPRRTARVVVPRLAILCLTLCLAALLAPGEAAASRNDFSLHRFLTCPDNIPRCTGGIARDSAGRIQNLYPDTEGFRQFASELGLALAPRGLSSAATLGEAGFEFALASSFTPVDPQADHWVKAKSADSSAAPSSVLTTLQLQLRKGLPFSLELGGSLVHLVESSMFTLGAELKWALVEGIKNVPDLAVRVSANRLLGNTQLDMITGNVDATISKSFGLGNTLRLSPFAGYAHNIVYAASHVLDATPGIDSFPSSMCVENASGQLVDSVTGRRTSECVRSEYSRATNDWEANFILPGQLINFYQIFGGVQLNITVLTIVAEFAYSPVATTYGAKLGFNF